MTGLGPSRGMFERRIERRSSGSFFGGMQSSSIPKYWMYLRWEGVVNSSTLPPRRLQQRCNASEQFSTQPNQANKQAQIVRVRPFPVYSSGKWEWTNLPDSELLPRSAHHLEAMSQSQHIFSSAFLEREKAFPTNHMKSHDHRIRSYRKFHH